MKHCSKCNKVIFEDKRNRAVVVDGLVMCSSCQKQLKVGWFRESWYEQ